MNLAPIGLSTYSRLIHLKQTLEALKANTLAKESDLYIFSDAAKPGDEGKVYSIRKYIENVSGFKSVHVIKRTVNSRIRNNRDGMAQLLKKFGKCIYLEEDIVTAPGFLRFMNESLNVFEKEKKIFSISGYCPPINIPANYSNNSFILRRACAWGMGIWYDRFKNISYLDNTEVLNRLSNNEQVAELSKYGEDLLEMILSDAAGKIDAFDVKMFYYQFLNEKYTIYPRKSLAKNIGHDGTGVHCGQTNKFTVDLWGKLEFEISGNVVLDDRIVKANYRFRKINRVPRVIENFNSKMPENISEMNKLGENIIFLISQPRAGSTLLQRILSGHSDIHTIAEPWIMLHPLYAIKNKGLLAEFDSNLARQGLEDFISQVPEGQELYFTALRRMGWTLYNRALEVSGKRFFLDKTPRYYLIIPELKKVFPKAKFIFLLRNPLAILSSTLKTWFQNNLENLKKSPNYLDIIEGPSHLVHGIQLLAKDAIVVKYEELVECAENSVGAICERLGISFHREMLTYGDKPKPNGRFGDPIGIYQHSRPVPHSIDKWQINISSPELVEFADQYLRTLGSDIVSKMGYNFEELQQKLDSQRRLGHNPQANIERVRILNKEGESLFARGDIDAALNKLQKAFDLNPNDAETNNNLGVIYYHKGKKKTASKHYQKATELMPENITFQKNLAYFYYVEQGRVEEAMQIYVRVLNANPEDIETLLVLAHICVALEKFDDAKYFSSCILKIEPGNKDAREFLVKLEEYQLSDATGWLDPENKEGKTPDIQERILNQQREDLFAIVDLEGVSGSPALKNKKYSCKPTSREQTITITDGGKPMISVITPSLNQGQFIEHTIRSVLRQNYSNFQHIIIDGGSTDGTLEILKRYQHLKWVSEKDSGQSEALNKGFRIAEGEIIGWINSDDWYEPEAFKIVASFFKANPAKNVVMGNCNLVDENGIIFDKVINKARGFEELKKYWIGQSIPTQPAVFFRRKLLDQYGYVDETLHYAMDYDLWMRFAQKNYFYHLDVTIANYRFHKAAKGGDQDWNKFVPEWNLVSKRYINLTGSSPKVSVIIPCYNYARYLSEAVESTILQSFQNFEIIIVNDGSTDSTREVAESLIAKYPNYSIRLINQKNSGQPAISRNRGILEANGEYILCLDADDMLSPTMIEKCLNVLEHDKSVAIAYTDRQDFDGVDQIVRAKNYDFSQLKYANHISYCALFRREVWDKIGGYRTNIKGCEDWDFWVAAGARGYFGRRIPEPLFKYRRHDTGVYQEVLENYNEKFAQIILNNQETYNSSDLNLAATCLGKKSEIKSDRVAEVSVIVPTFNRPEMLEETLKSILDQTYQNFEIVVVNDGGIEVSRVVDNFQDPRIKYLSHKKNKGLAAARNTGIRNASGKYIALLDDDDIFYPEHLQTAVDMLSNEIQVIYTDAARATYDRCGDNYRLIKKNVPYSLDFDRNKLLVGNLSPVNCFVFEKSLALKAGLFDETLNTLEDWDFWIRLSSLTSFKHIAKPTVQVNWRSDGTTMTSLLGTEFKKNRQRIHEKYRDEINRIPNVKEILDEFQKIWVKDWQVESPLTSIVILTCNQLQYTKKCLESIFQNTQKPYEIIIVDNGSTDGTVQYLESEVLKNHSDARIKILKNDENNGFAGGNNQGIASASGDYILLLNNDVVVTPGWLNRMLSCAERRPEIGIVGPRSNYVSGPQLVEGVDYDIRSLKGLNEFSEKLADDHTEQSQQVLRVVGFCMLIKRAVINKIGGMDSRYGLGNFEDDDFSLRAAIAGFQSWIARDCFVHHFGHRTFIGENVNLSKSLIKNWGVFKEKWGLPADKPYGSSYGISEMKHTRFDPSIHYYPLGDERAVMDESNNHFKSAEALHSDILAHLNAKPSKEVIEDLLRLIEFYPEFALAYNDLGVLYYKSGNREKALKCYESAVRLDPENSNFCKNLADFYFVETGRVEEALQIYVSVLKADPQDVEALMATGLICKAANRFDDAGDFFNRVLQIEPWNADARKHMEEMQKQRTSASSSAEEAEDAYRRLQEKMNFLTPAEAIGEVEKLVELFPDFAVGHNDLGVLYYQAGNKEKTLQHYRQAALLQPENITLQKNLADFLFVELGKVEEALQIYMNILATHPDDVETLLITGHICVALRKFDGARGLYERVLALAPDNEDAAKNLEALMSRQVEQPPEKPDFLNDVAVSSAENVSTDLNTAESETRGTETKTIVSIILGLDGIQNRIRECLKSIQVHTPAPHELFLVACGATRGMLKWAQQLIKDNAHCHIIECARQAGRAGAFNQAIRKASGEMIVLMHNDVVVPESWLEGFKMRFNLGPHIGVMGPMSNRAAGIQQIAHSDESERIEFESFAKAFSKQNQYRRVQTWKLSDFCLAFRRELPDKIGYLDEKFASEEMIVEDFCSRAAAGGYQNLIAADTYVFHYDRHKVRKSASTENSDGNEDRKRYKEKWNCSQNKEVRALQTVQYISNANELSQKGQIDQAVEILLNAIRVQPEERRLYLELAEILMAAKRFQDAKDALNEMPAPAENGNPEIKKVLLLGYAEEGLENYEAARAFAEQVLEMDSNHAQGLNLKGILAYRNNDRDSAEKCFRQAIASDPGYGEPYTNLAMLQLETKQPEKALEFFEKGFILSPTDLDIATNYHAFIEGLGDFERAENVARQAAFIYPNNKKIKYMLIDFLVRQGNYEIAMPEIEDAITKFGIEDGILGAALKVREKLGPLAIDKSSKQAPVSLCMIIKDEEKHLGRCLASVKPIVDEMIVVDTGSTDRSKDIAVAFGAKVYDYEWRDDFAAARNYSISKASGNWILILDGDEVISRLDHADFRKIVKKIPRTPIAYSITTRNYSKVPNIVGWVPNDGQYPEEEATFGWLPSEKVRLFCGRDQIRFEGAVHEMVDPFLKRNGIEIKKCRIPVHHYGRLDQEKLGRKGETYFDIGQKKLSEKGEDVRALWELAIQATVLEKNEQALELWQRLLALNPNPKLAANAYVNMGNIYNRLGIFEDALIVGKKAVVCDPDLKEAQYNQALAELQCGNATDTIRILEGLLNRFPDYPPAEFILSAAYCCAGPKEKGLDGIRKLKNTPLGAHLEMPCLELGQSLLAAKKVEYALRVLGAAIECDIVNKGILDLFTECVQMNAKTKKLSKIPATVLTDRQPVSFEDLHQ